MIDKKYHILISGEGNSTRSFLIHMHTIATIGKIFLGVVVLFFIILGVGSWKSINTLKANKALQAQIALLSNQLVSQETILPGFDEGTGGERIEIVISGDSENKINNPIIPAPTALSQTADTQDTSQSMSTDAVANVDSKPAPEIKYSQPETAENSLSSPQNPLLENTIQRLDERSRLIEKVMNKIGVYVKVKNEDEKNKGGPYISPEQAYSETLLNRTDRYINILEKLPLGRPLVGKITSKFGWRTDPFLKKPALHGGADIKGKKGDKVRATADGVVSYTGYDKSGYGYYVKISHENNYESIFGHLSKILVKKGEKISRRHVIGLVGSTGRSTGPHLHYELRYKGTHINPARYMRVADLVFFLSN